MSRHATHATPDAWSEASAELAGCDRTAETLADALHFIGEALIADNNTAGAAVLAVHDMALALSDRLQRAMRATAGASIAAAQEGGEA